MCGIAGLVGRWPGATATTASRLLRSIRHRGPDEHGMLVYGGGSVRIGRDLDVEADMEAVLLHRRLSIVDLSAAGWQPLSTSDGRYHVVFNGEIYNHLELRTRLEAAGARFRSRSDTEVLLQAFAYWGHGAWRECTGMFACAILDVDRRCVILARDPFGIKPLYYVTSQRALVFASEIKTLLGLPGLSRDVDAQRLAGYLRFGITDCGDGTLFASIRQLAPGTAVEVDLASPATRRVTTFWMPSRSRGDGMPFDEAVRTFRDYFLESVALQVRSDVPVACCLSGGIDSSAIATAMREVAGRGLDLHAFSFIADTPVLSEERWIDLAAAAAGATVHKVSATATEMVADLESLVAVQDEPFISSSIYAQYRVMRTIGEAKFKVVLDGQGADEMLGGYEFYLGARVASLLRAGRLGAAATLVRRARSRRGIPALRQLATAMDYLLPPRASAVARRLVGRELVPSWVNRRWLDRHDASIDSLRTAAAADVLLESLERSLRGPGLPQLLRYEDRNSMAWSVESRVPFLTPKLVDFALSLPERYIIAGDGTTKHVFREAMRGLVPDPILDRRDKIGFATSECDWILAVSPWVDRLLSHEVARRIPALDHTALAARWQAIKCAERPYDPAIWRCLNLIEWSRQHDVRYD